jgi:hypothetical protein
MGFNPHRKRVTRPTDVVFVGGAIVVTLAAMIWVLFS